MDKYNETNKRNYTIYNPVKDTYTVCAYAIIGEKKVNKKRFAHRKNLELILASNILLVFNELNILKMINKNLTSHLL